MYPAWPVSNSGSCRCLSPEAQEFTGSVRLRWLRTGWESLPRSYARRSVASCAWLMLQKLLRSRRSFYLFTSWMRVLPSVSSSDGLLDVVLTLEVGTHVANSVTLQTFTLNGTLPGLRVRAGDRLRVLFQNRLPAQPNSKRVHNEFGYVDESNLHWHGLHVPGELPSDDTKLVVGPGQEFQYETLLREDHMPGTHWIHPHRHGSSALQVGCGAALALIVEDPANSLPAQVASAEEVVMVVQDLALVELSRIARQSGTRLCGPTPAGDPQTLC